MALNNKLIEQLEKDGFTEKQIDYINRNVYKQFRTVNNYKILCNRKYPVFINEFNGMKFYKILVVKKDLNGNKINAYKQVKFVGCKPVEKDGDEIYINEMFEDFYFKKGDKYNPIWMLCIKSYALADDEEREEFKAVSEYNRTTYENTYNDGYFELKEDDLVSIDDSFDDNFLD